VAVEGEPAAPEPVAVSRLAPGAVAVKGGPEPAAPGAVAVRVSVRVSVSRLRRGPWPWGCPWAGTRRRRPTDTRTTTLAPKTRRSPTPARAEGALTDTPPRRRRSADTDTDTDTDAGAVARGRHVSFCNRAAFSAAPMNEKSPAVSWRPLACARSQRRVHRHVARQSRGGRPVLVAGATRVSWAWVFHRVAPAPRLVRSEQRSMKPADSRCQSVRT